MPWIVDGMNLIGSRADGWWRDRPAARRRLVGELAAFAAREREEGGSPPVAVVFDGRPTPGEAEAAEESGVEATFAPGGPNAADMVIADMVRRLEEPGGTTVVTSDAALAAQVRSAGGVVMGVVAFGRLLGR